MLDLAAKIETRNYGLRKTTDPRTLLESLRVILPLVIIAAAFSFRIWVCSESIHIGYQSQQLSALVEDSLRTQQQLILEEQTLKDPKSLESIARDLGMIPLRPDQLILAPVADWDAGSLETLALMNPYRPSEPRKPSAFN